jgi:hypothetical protein
MARARQVRHTPAAQHRQQEHTDCHKTPAHPTRESTRDQRHVFPHDLSRSANRDAPGVARRVNNVHTPTEAVHCKQPTATVTQIQPSAKHADAEWGPQTLRQACYRENPESAMCVQNLNDSRGLAIRITYRISLRSSSLWEPRHPLLKVVGW